MAIKDQLLNNHLYLTYLCQIPTRNVVECISSILCFLSYLRYVLIIKNESQKVRLMFVSDLLLGFHELISGVFFISLLSILILSIYHNKDLVLRHIDIDLTVILSL